MSNFIGEFECKLDIKSRITLPAGLVKQLPPEAQSRFVINRGFERHLYLYPINEWESIRTEVDRLNTYNEKHRRFMRYFYRGASELKLDRNNRLLLSKRLLEYAQIDSDITLFAHGNKIEIWASHLYNELLTDEPEDFADLAEEVLGNTKAERESSLIMQIDRDRFRDH